MSSDLGSGSRLFTAWIFVVARPDLLVFRRSRSMSFPARSVSCA